MGDSCRDPIHQITSEALLCNWSKRLFLFCRVFRKRRRHSEGDVSLICGGSSLHATSKAAEPNIDLLMMPLLLAVLAAWLEIVSQHHRLTCMYKKAMHAQL